MFSVVIVVLFGEFLHFEILPELAANTQKELRTFFFFLTQKKKKKKWCACVCRRRNAYVQAPRNLHGYAQGRTNGSKQKKKKNNNNKLALNSNFSFSKKKKKKKEEKKKNVRFTRNNNEKKQTKKSKRKHSFTEVRSLRFNFVAEELIRIFKGHRNFFFFFSYILCSRNFRFRNKMAQLLRKQKKSFTSNVLVWLSGCGVWMCVTCVCHLQIWKVFYF